MIPKIITEYKGSIMFRTLKDNFKPAISLLDKVIDKKPALPILKHIHVDVYDSKLLLTATNLWETVSVYVGARNDTKTEFGFTIDSAILKKIIPNIDTPAIDFDVTVDESSTSAGISITYGDSTVTTDGFHTNEYPPIYKYDDLDAHVKITNVKKFLLALNRCLPCVAQDTRRPILQYIDLNFSEEHVSISSTDGVSLSSTDVDVEWQHNFREKTETHFTRINMSEKLATLLLSTIDPKKHYELDIVLPQNDSKYPRYLIVFGQYIFQSNICEGKFPEFNHLKINDTDSVRVQTEDILRAVNQVEAFTNYFMLEVQNGMMYVKSYPKTENGMVSTSFVVESDTNIDFGKFQVAAILPVIKRISTTKEVVFDLFNGTPAQITLQDGSIYLIMPVE